MIIFAMPVPQRGSASARYRTGIWSLRGTVLLRPTQVQQDAQPTPASVRTCPKTSERPRRRSRVVKAQPEQALAAFAPGTVIVITNCGDLS